MITSSNVDTTLTLSLIFFIVGAIVFIIARYFAQPSPEVKSQANYKAPPIKYGTPEIIGIVLMVLGSIGIISGLILNKDVYRFTV